MSVFVDILHIIKSGLFRLSQANFYTTIGLALLFSVVCSIVCNYYSRLWNKAYRTTLLHRVLSYCASALTFFFILTFIALGSLKEIAQYNISIWSKDLSDDAAWTFNATKQAYDKVKSAGLEDFSNYPEPSDSSVNIPITKNETIETCANHFADEACKNFDDEFPFLSKIVWAKSSIPSEVVQNDLKEYFGDIRTESNTPSHNSIGTDDEFIKRLNRENAKSGDIQISLLWNNFNDLDLHCVDPSGEEIFYLDKTSSKGGTLDVDMNGEAFGSEYSNEPIENIFWADGDAPIGHYKIMVEHYANHGANDPTDFKVRTVVDDNIQEFDGSLSDGDSKALIFEFDYRGKPSTINKSYQARDAVRLVATTIKSDLESQAPQVVTYSRILLVILFLLVQSIPFGLIGFAAYKDLKIKT